jgi:hypothetical protein
MTRLRFETHLFTMKCNGFAQNILNVSNLHMPILFFVFFIYDHTSYSRSFIKHNLNSNVHIKHELAHEKLFCVVWNINLIILNQDFHVPNFSIERGKIFEKLPIILFLK